MKCEVVVNENGDKFHYVHNGSAILLHREDGPAIERANGTREWYLNGELHREDGPAIEEANGTTRWFLNGKLHRVGGPAHEDVINGCRAWFMHGMRHREDGPANEWSFGVDWYFEDECIEIPKCKHLVRHEAAVCPSCLKSFRKKVDLLKIRSVMEE